MQTVWTIWRAVLSEIHRVSITHIVFQALNDLDAIVAQVELFEVDEVLQTLDFSDPVTLQIALSKMISERVNVQAEFSAFLKPLRQVLKITREIT